MAIYSHNHIRESARELIKKFELEEPPVDVRQIAKKLDIEIIELTLPIWFSGALLNTAGDFYIVLNKVMPETRKTFTIAHEIAHHQMDHHELCYLENRQKPFYHLEADIYAAELCMPSTMVRREASRWSNDHKFLAQLFNVDEQTMIRKLEELNLIPQGRHSWQQTAIFGASY